MNSKNAKQSQFCYRHYSLLVVGSNLDTLVKQELNSIKKKNRTFTNLSSHIEPESRLGFVNCYNARPVRIQCTICFIVILHFK